jgi:alkanesulfonate monooxygenase SsuD/methylene tetrahydromethanopterin reductase-like flavin-dependent oxidoreductase (luciferase family)
VSENRSHKAEDRHHGIGLFAIGIGRTADPEAIAQIAGKADEIGFASLWAPEHIVLFDEADYTSR